MTARTQTRATRARARLLFLGAALFVGAATWLILVGRSKWAGGATGIGALCLMLGSSVARGAGPADRILGSLADRAFDGCVLAAIAWTTRASDRGTSGLALVALVAGFLGAYIRARGASLEYDVGESPVTRGLRYGIVAAGLATGALRAAMIASAAVSALAAAVRASQVAKEERA
ncbi:MAG: hypothetical protein ACT4PO_06780 [Actinomycetota bacterium]